MDNLGQTITDYKKTLETLRQRMGECRLLSQNKNFTRVDQKEGGTELELEIDNILYLVEYSGEITNFVPQSEDETGQFDFEITICGISQCPKDGISENYIPVEIIDSLIFKQILSECERHFLENHDDALYQYELYHNEK